MQLKNYCIYHGQSYPSYICVPDDRDDDDDEDEDDEDDDGCCCCWCCAFPYVTNIVSICRVLSFVLLE